jgi:hypothetical protein
VPSGQITKKSCKLAVPELAIESVYLTVSLEFNRDTPYRLRLIIASGETYDFEFRSDLSGEIPLQFKNMLNGANLANKIVVQ